MTGVVLAIVALVPGLSLAAWYLRRAAEELRLIRQVMERSEAAIEAGLLDEEVRL